MALTEMVIMPGADYQDIVDATREKTGGTDLLKSGEVGAAIRGIKAGGFPNGTEWTKTLSVSGTVAMMKFSNT